LLVRKNALTADMKCPIVDAEVKSPTTTFLRQSAV
jgi:hypothetical protein